MLLPELREADSLLILGVVILAGVIAGSLAKRIKLPSVTGQVLIGVLIGHSGLDLFPEEKLRALQPVTVFALGLMTFTIGAHLNFNRLRGAGKRLGYLLICEAILVPLAVIVFLLPNFELRESALYAALAISTAPATIVALVRETRSRGVFVKTLFAAVALNNLVCVVLFEVARTVARAHLTGDSGEGPHVVQFLVGPGLQILTALAIGGGLGFVMHLLTRRVLVGQRRQATASVLSLLLCLGIAGLFDVSPLLACMFLGLVQANLTRHREHLVDSVFENFQQTILAIFFTLAGMHLSFEHAAEAGLLAGLLLTGRFLGKLVAAEAAMRLAGAPDYVRKNLGPALIPQAGVAVGLVVVVKDDPQLSGIADLFTAVVLTVVTINEIIGPLLTRWALGRSGEAGRDRTRLLDFIGEESIVTDLKAASMEEAIEQLTAVLVRSHQLPRSTIAPLRSSVLDREAQVSTVFGGGLAIPHGVLEDGKEMIGVMGISREGLDLPSPDGKPVHCMVLLATPSGQRDRHLEVLAALARTVGADEDFRERLFDARSPAHAYDLLHGERADGFNYFLQEDEDWSTVRRSSADPA